MQFQNMTVLITGASGGIGREVSKKLAQQGANLHLTARNVDELDELTKQLRSQARHGQQISSYSVNLLDQKQLNGLCSQLSALPTPINVVINNAGLSRFDWLENHSQQDVENIFQLNAIVPIKLIRTLLPSLKAQSQARIINVASTFASLGFPGYSVYAASKHAIKGFSESLSRELADTHVSVGCFMPRATQTNLNSDAVTAMNRALKATTDTPSDVAHELVTFVTSLRTQKALGWPEKAWVRINGLLPEVVSIALKNRLPTIKHYVEHDEASFVALGDQISKPHHPTLSR